MSCKKLIVDWPKAPEWVLAAAVDKYGDAHLIGLKIHGGHWVIRREKEGIGFDASDWQHSLQVRPQVSATLNDIAHAGEIASLKDELIVALKAEADAKLKHKQDAEILQRFIDECTRLRAAMQKATANEDMGIIHAALADDDHFRDAAKKVRPVAGDDHSGDDNEMIQDDSDYHDTVALYANSKVTFHDTRPPMEPADLAGCRVKELPNENGEFPTFWVVGFDLKGVFTVGGKITMFDLQKRCKWSRDGKTWSTDWRKQA